MGGCIALGNEEEEEEGVFTPSVGAPCVSVRPREGSGLNTPSSKPSADPLLAPVGLQL